MSWTTIFEISTLVWAGVGFFAWIFGQLFENLYSNKYLEGQSLSPFWNRVLECQLRFRIRAVTFGKMMSWAACFAFISALFYVSAMLPVLRQRSLNQPAEYTTTTLNSSAVTTFQGIQKEVNGLVVRDTSSGIVIYQGRIEVLDNIGGGMRSICVMRDRDKVRMCGVADTTLGAQKGQVGYLRQVHVSISAELQPDGYTQWDSYRMLLAISEPEALALQKLGAKIHK